MDEKLTTKSIGKGIEEVKQKFLLYEKPLSRLFFHAQIHEGGIRGNIIRERKESKDASWIKDKHIDIRKLKKDEGINIEMKTEAIRNLYTAINKCSTILEEKGIQYGENKYAIVDPSKVIITKENIATYIKKILEEGYGEEIWESLSESNPSLITKLSYAKIISEKEQVLSEFEEYLTKNKNEQFWQEFFKKNTWIFGYGLKYQFLNLINDQPRYGGTNYTGTGEQKGDYLLHSEAEIKYTVLVEIKKPQTKIIHNDDDYRNGTSRLDSELLWATSQLQINCNSWAMDGSRKDVARDDLESKQIFTYQPKGILIIGHTNQLNSRNKINTFGSFRNNLHNPEIITFDELYERAKYIISHNKTTLSPLTP